MIANRPDWVVSRQRAWGVPIAIFVDADHKPLVDQAVNARILDAFAQEGADAWYAEGARERFLGERAHEPWQKVDDVLDVWFDSGSTHAFTLEDPRQFPALAGIQRRRDDGGDEVMYLEGSDQHRGWFHSSLLESCGTRGRAPYDAVLTHGFVLDEHGRKMSKSVGNVIAPQTVIKESGADILRLWVAASDYADDLRIGPEILKTFVETYKKLRNTLRWMLGALGHHEPGREIVVADMDELERLMLHRLAELDVEVREAYARFDFKRVVARLSAFLAAELSAFYFDIRKDALYCDAPSSARRLGRADDHRAHLPLRHAVAGTDPRLHGRGGLAVARPRGHLGAPRVFSRCAPSLAQRGAGREMGPCPRDPRRRHRRAGDRPHEQGDRLLAGSRTSGLSRNG